MRQLGWICRSHAIRGCGPVRTGSRGGATRLRRNAGAPGAPPALAHRRSKTPSARTSRGAPRDGWRHADVSGSPRDSWSAAREPGTELHPGAGHKTTVQPPSPPHVAGHPVTIWDPRVCRGVRVASEVRPQVVSRGTRPEQTAATAVCRAARQSGVGRRGGTSGPCFTWNTTRDRSSQPDDQHGVSARATDAHSLSRVSSTPCFT